MEKNQYTPTISVIVPVYNVEPYLHQCVDSILAQSFTDFELILVDDGSRDNCGAICDSYAVKDPRVVVIHQLNQGLSAARNAALDIMRGQYVFFVDSDDAIHPLALELHYRNALDHNADVTKSFPYLFTNDEDLSVEPMNQPTVNLVTGRDACFELYDPNGWYFTVWDKLIKSSLLADIRFSVGLKYEDEAIIYKIYYAAKKVAEINETLYYYRRNPNGIMSEKFSLKWYDRVKVFSARASFFAQRNEQELAERAKALADIFQAKYAIRTRKLHMYSDVCDEYKMSFWRALGIIKRNCSEDNFQYWLNYINPMLLRPYLYFGKLKSMFKK